MGCGASSPAPQPTAAPEPTKPKPAEPAPASEPEPYVLAMATSRAKFVGVRASLLFRFFVQSCHTAGRRAWHACAHYRGPLTLIRASARAPKVQPPLLARGRGGAGCVACQQNRRTQALRCAHGLRGRPLRRGRRASGGACTISSAGGRRSRGEARRCAQARRQSLPSLRQVRLLAPSPAQPCAALGAWVCAGGVKDPCTSPSTALTRGMRGGVAWHGGAREMAEEALQTAGKTMEVGRVNASGVLVPGQWCGRPATMPG